MGIAPRTRIAVPVPDAAEFRSFLVDPYREAQLPQSVEWVEAGKARADDEDVELLHWSMTGDAFRCRRRCRRELIGDLVGRQRHSSSVSIRAGPILSTRSCTLVAA